MKHKQCDSKHNIQKSDANESDLSINFNKFIHFLCTCFDKIFCCSHKITSDEQVGGNIYHLKQESKHYENPAILIMLTFPIWSCLWIIQYSLALVFIILYLVLKYLILSLLFPFSLLSANSRLNIKIFTLVEIMWESVSNTPDNLKEILPETDSKHGRKIIDIITGKQHSFYAYGGVSLRTLVRKSHCLRFKSFFVRWI